MNSKENACVPYHYDNMGCEIFKQGGGTKLESILHKNQHPQRKLLKFENWVNGEVLKIEHIFMK